MHYLNLNDIVSGYMQYYEYFKDVEKEKPKGLRGRVRDIALSGLYTLEQLKGMEQALSRPRIQFLYFHHLFKDEERNLEILVKRLSKQHSFISYSDAVDRIWRNDIDKPYIVFSSDDGFKNNLKASELLKAYGISACFFINPGITDGLNFDQAKMHCSQQLNFPPVDFMDWKDIEALQKSGHEIGSHTMFHMNVAKMEPAVFYDDTITSYEIIKRHCGEVSHFAYPYGRFGDFNEEGRKSVFNAGFKSCASAVRGCHIPVDNQVDPHQLCIRRDHLVFGWSLDHMMWFISNNSKKATADTNLFPYTYA